MIAQEKDQHAEALLMLLSLQSPCTQCPYSFDLELIIHCLVCRAFIGLEAAIPDIKKCPCHTLGTSEAIKRTWIALEEGGYLKC